MDSTAPIHTWHRGVHTPTILGSATGRSSQFQRLASGLGISKVTAGRRGGGRVAGGGRARKDGGGTITAGAPRALLGFFFDVLGFFTGGVLELLSERGIPRLNSGS